MVFFGGVNVSNPLRCLFLILHFRGTEGSVHVDVDHVNRHVRWFWGLESWDTPHLVLLSKTMYIECVFAMSRGDTLVYCYHKARCLLEAWNEISCGFMR